MTSNQTARPILLSYSSGRRRSYIARRRWLRAGWAMTCGSVAAIVWALLQNGPRHLLWVDALTPGPGNHPMLAAGVGLGLVAAAVAIFRINREYGGLAMCTILAIFETVVAMFAVAG